jgi:poly(A) polymerase
VQVEEMALLNPVQKELREGAVNIIAALRNEGYEALLAGGVVRDLLLQREVSDIDIATSAPPEEVERIFEHTIPVGKQFGVIIVVAGSHHYEIATFRADAEYRDGRHPTAVAYTNAEEDARRRDFTVNALFYDPSGDRVIDYVDGRKDLNSLIIRTVGNPESRFKEDKLRILRAVRLACQLGFKIDAETFGQVKRMSSLILEVSAERIRDELIKIFRGPDPAAGLDLLSEAGILRVTLPEVEAMKGVAQPPQFHPEGDVYVHTRLMLSLSRNPSRTLAMGILLHDVGKPPTFRLADRIRFDGHAEVGAKMSKIICRRLRFSKGEEDKIVDLVRNHLKFIHVRQMRESTLKRFLRKEDFFEHLELHRLDCIASHGDLTNHQFCIDKLAEFGQEAIRPDPLIGGRDLIGLGLEPGPLFSRILNAIEDLQLEGKVNSREEALEWVNRNFV